MIPSIKIIKAEDIGNLQVLIHFSDSKQQTIDIGDFIRRHPHPQYNKYLDPKRFRKFAVENRNNDWGNICDLIFPFEQLYSGTLL